MPHVCILTTAHPTDDVRVNSRLARSFLGAGFEVTWVGPSMSYFTESTTPEPDVTYRLFRPNDSRLRRATARRAAAAAAEGLSEVDWWYSPDPDAAEVAVDVARRVGGRVIFDVHEVFHESLLDRWFPGRAPSPLRELVRRRIAATCRRADLVSGVSRAVLAPYVPDGRSPLVVRNCAPREFGAAAVRGERAPGTRLRLTHGKAMPSNGTMALLGGLAQLGAEDQRRVAVHMVRTPALSGGFAEDFERAHKSLLDPDLLQLEDGVPHDAVPQLLAAQDVGVVAYQRDLGIDSLPNRLFEYMAAGLAVLVPSYSTEIVSIVEQEDIGLTADFEDPSSIAAAVRWLLEHPEDVATMGRRARAAFLERHHWGVEFDGLLERMGSVAR